MKGEEGEQRIHVGADETSGASPIELSFDLLTRRGIGQARS